MPEAAADLEDLRAPIFDIKREYINRQKILSCGDGMYPQYL